MTFPHLRNLIVLFLAWRRPGREMGPYVLVALCAICLAGIGCQKETIAPECVCPAADRTLRRVPGEYATIQEAILSASSGDTVLLAAGGYRGSGNRDLEIASRELTLIGEDGRDRTVILCEGTESDPHFGISCPDSRVLIEGVTIDGAWSPGHGGAVTVSSGSVEMKDCVLRSCVAATGAGMFAELAEVTMTDCRVSDCRSSGSEGVVAVLSAVQSMIEADDCVFMRNLAGNGAIIAIELGELRLKSSQAYGCISRDGVVAGFSSEVELEDCTLANNEGSSCGAISLMDNSTGSLSGCTVARNAGGICGGARVDSPAALSLELTIMRGNCGGTVGDLLALGPVEVEACALDTTGIQSLERISYDACLVTEDPLFCVATPCGADSIGSYRRRHSSPCWSWNNPCHNNIGSKLGECPKRVVTP